MTARPLKFPGQLNAQRFLDVHWQKKPLWIADAIAVELPALSADELGWLATLDDVESRLVFTERHEDTVTYRVEHGPFASAELEELPRQDWTLLVQDVDKHLPDFRAYFELTDFVPDWRIDDLMVSFAAPGGSVGPHRDHYDVFLVQGSGSRNWSLAEPGTVSSAAVPQALSLLEEFVDPAPVLAGPGDILYLPPGFPHWGIAETQCITYSIGMRAPTLAEFTDHLEDAGGHDSDANTEIFYQDPELSTLEALPGLISGQAILRMRTTLGADSDLTDEQIAIAFGSIVTAPKAWLAPDTLSRESARGALSSVEPEGEWVLHGMSHLAYYESTGTINIFANGSSKAADRAISELIQDLCKQRMIAGSALHCALDDRRKKEVILWLCEQGIFDL